MSKLEDPQINRPVPITTEEFDRKVEAGEDIDEHLDWENAVTIMPGELSHHEEIALIKKKLSLLQSILGELVETVEQFDKQEAIR